MTHSHATRDSEMGRRESRDRTADLRHGAAAVSYQTRLLKFSSEIAPYRLEFADRQTEPEAL